PQVAPWLLQFRAASRPERLVETARLIRPLFARALAEHEALLAEAGAERYLRKTGWLKLYRSDRAFDALKREFALAQEFGMPQHVLDPDGARELEPSLAPVFRHAVFWPRAASVTNPLAVTEAYAARFAALGGVVVRGNARSLHRANARWRIETAEGPLDAAQAVVALGPFAPDVLSPLGITLPLGVKRGYHRHYRGAGNAALARPVVDIEMGYCLAPMGQRIRLPAGVRVRRRRGRAAAGAVRSLAAVSEGPFPAGRAARGGAMDGQPAVLCGFPAGDRPRAGTEQAVARLRPRPLGIDAGPCDGAAPRR